MKNLISDKLHECGRGYIFGNRMKNIVKFWRREGFRIIIYIEFAAHA